ncbi:cationic peroxidase 1-like [Cynara cardunculus var. scolymus]|uniref:cationic peroxidase 1-like n=1 Tax=Cynara cardunculus var. scolymus TaxID=59895 RepID=UPI000D6258E6|nr:cationic peroxidase 1-like [Cynara cardunculus var. scolymus]
MASSSFHPLICLTFLFIASMASAQLTANFYNRTCPTAMSIIRGGVSTAIARERRMGASLLRLHFHDCFVNGCDASVLLDATATSPGEKSSRSNANSIRGFEVVDTIKSQLESSCPGVVSCADLLTVAARDATVALGGQTWNVVLGRRDSATASLDAANSDLPSPFLDLPQLISVFGNKGFSPQEMVALTGAHEIGQASCGVFRERIYNETNIDPSFALSMQTNCPRTGGDANLAPLDSTTPTVFDNAFFRNLVNQRGLLHSDQQIYSGGSTNAQVDRYRLNSAAFFTDFANAMVTMGNLSPLTGTNGQIRTNCRRAN